VGPKLSKVLHPVFAPFLSFQTPIKHHESLRGASYVRASDSCVRLVIGHVRYSHEKQTVRNTEPTCWSADSCDIARAPVVLAASVLVNLTWHPTQKQAYENMRESVCWERFREVG
jgi:hypothetical protein